MTKARHLLSMAMFLFLAGGLFAQNPCLNQPEVDQDYVAVTSNLPDYTLIDISATGTFLGTGDDAAFTASLNHPFTYFGNPVTDLRVATNGYITSDLGDTGPDLSNDCPLPATPSTGSNTPRLYPLHDDINITMSLTLQYDMPAIYPHPADAGMGAHVIQWDGVHFGGSAQVLFQTVLFDNGDIVYVIGATGNEFGSGSTTGWQEGGSSANAFTFACNTANSVPDGSVFGISAHGTTDFADAVAACEMNTGKEEVNLAAISEINLTLNANCRAFLLPSQILTGDFDVDGNDTFPIDAAFNIVVQDGSPEDGPMIDGCGRFLWTVTADTALIEGFTTAWGYVNAEDKTSPLAELLPEAPEELFCTEIADVNINTLANNISRCYTVNSDGDPVQANFVNTPLGQKLVAGGGLPLFTDGCSNIEICVNDIVVNTDPCADVVITRVFTATDGDCPSVSGEENAPTVAQYDITFTRPSLEDVEEVPAVANFSCEDFDFSDPNPQPQPEDYPFIVRANGEQVFLGESFCNLGATFSDGPRIVTCDNTYKFVRTYTVVDWCDVDNVETFSQLVKVGDFEAPELTLPTQDLDFNGIPDDGPLFFSTNSLDCSAFFVIPAGSAVDNCDAAPVVTAVVYAFGDETSTPIGPFSVGQLAGGFPIGTHILRYTATDDCGNEVSEDVEFTVDDATAPVAICEDGLNISIGGTGVAVIHAEDIDRASYDDCSDVTLAIACVNDENQAVNDAQDATDGNNDPYDPTLIVTCDDLGFKRIGLRVTDAAGNVNYCWLDVLIEDKAAPVCIPPAPRLITCADLEGDFPQDLNAEFASDPEGTAALLDAQFGNANGLDNCPDVTIAQTVVDNRTSCGTGTIQRTFTVTDAVGLVSGPGCTQLIVVQGLHDYTVVFPADEENSECVEPDYMAVTFEENGCDLITVSTEVDTFTATADECYKLRITYEVLNWCEYNGEDDPYIIPRDADNDNILTERTWLHVIPRDETTLTDDLAFLDRDNNRNNTNTIANLDTGDGGILFGSDAAGYGQDGSRGAFLYRQFIKVYDDTAPTLVAEDVLEPFCDDDGDCLADADFTFTVSDDCSPASVNATASLDAFRVDANGDGVYTLAEFVADGGDITDAITNDGEGNFSISLSDLPIGEHAIRIVATDGCGNTSVDLILFEVIDCKAPTPICINGLTATLMPDGEGGGMAAIWASDFIASPSTDCSGEVKFAIYRADDAAAPDFAGANPIDTGLQLTCEDLGMVVIRIYAIDPFGNADYCETSLFVQAFQEGVCAGDGAGSLAGTITTPNAAPMNNVTVNINDNAAMTDATTTQNGGAYTFADLTEGMDYTVQPAYDPSVNLNNVSTGDLILISRHILGIQTLTSEFQEIAADVTLDASINVLDIIAIRRVILGLDASFQATSSWRFRTNDGAEVFNINNLTGAYTGADFTAIEMGNVSDATENGYAGNAAGRGVASIVADDITLTAGVPATVTLGAADLAGFQATLALTANVSIANVEVLNSQATGVNLEQVANGLVAISHIGSDAAITLELVAAEDVQLSEVLSLNNRLATSEGYLNGGVADLNLDFNSVAGEVSFALGQNSPNPFAEQTVIGFQLPAAAQVSLTVQDVQGRVILNRELEGVAGYNRTELNVADLKGATGVLTYTVVAGDFTATRKMVVIK